jgi:hypothetical protein
MFSGLSEGSLIFYRTFHMVVSYHCDILLHSVSNLQQALTHHTCISRILGTANSNLLVAFDNLESVTREVKFMLDPNADPYAAAPATEADHSDLEQKMFLI